METPKKETVADALNESFAVSSYYSGVKGAQKLLNQRESHFADVVRYGTWPSVKSTPPSIWQKLWWKIQWPLGLRIVHEDNMCDCEEY